MFYKRFKVLRLAGFDVNIDISWVIIVVLIIWSLAVSLFPSQYPNMPTRSYVWMAALAAFGFFASIIIHEFCHALVARHYGLPMKGITLWMLGGVAEMSDEPPNAKTEFLMAGAGPLASIGIAAVCYGLATVATQLQWSVIAIAVFSYLWRINLILAIFNLIPAFPLDGGRLLRAILWGWKGRLQWATRVASRVGLGFGTILMVLGFLAFISGNLIGGIWYFLIGLFIRFAAQSSYAQLLVKGGLEDVPVRQLIKEELVAVPKEATIADLVENYFYRYQHRLFPVVDASNKLVGCVRLASVRNIPRSEWSDVRVKDVLEPLSEENTIESKESAFSAFKKMSRLKSDRMMLVEGDHVVGVISLNDVLRFVSMRLELGSGEEKFDHSDKMHRDPLSEAS